MKNINILPYDHMTIWCIVYTVIEYTTILPGGEEMDKDLNKSLKQFKI